MVRAIKNIVMVKPGGLIEFRSDELRDGAPAEVIVMQEDRTGTEPPSLTSLIGQGKGCFGGAADVDAFIRKERDAWNQ